jgi:phosphohistidine phosphatase SixA
MSDRLLRRSVLAGGAAALGLAVGGCAEQRNPERAQALAALRGGGHVVYFRHAATDRPGTDSPDLPREQQRNLSPLGIAQSRRIGARFRALGLPVARVLASPFHRCTDMADLAFGGHVPEPMLIGIAGPGPGGRRAWLRRTLSETPPGQGNLILISHVHNLVAVGGPSLGEGEAAVIAPLGAGGFRVLARFAADEW